MPADDRIPTIEPALTPAEWKRDSGGRLCTNRDRLNVDQFGGAGGDIAIWDKKAPTTTRAMVMFTPAEAPLVIAVANASLTESDPRRLTRDDARILRRLSTSSATDEHTASTLGRIAAILDSYLPPDTSDA